MIYRVVGVIFAPKRCFLLFSATIVFISALACRNAEKSSSCVFFALYEAGKDGIVPNTN